MTREGIESTLNYAKLTVTSRKDLGGSVKEAICGQIVDIALCLGTYVDARSGRKLNVSFFSVVNRPELIPDNYLVDCLELFVNKNDKKKKPLNVINTRNIYLICEGPNANKSWAAYKKFVLALLRHRILSPKSFEEQILKLFQLDYPDVSFGNGKKETTK